jgi:hypothetical protein
MISDHSADLGDLHTIARWIHPIGDRQDLERRHKHRPDENEEMLTSARVWRDSGVVLGGVEVRQPDEVLSDGSNIERVVVCCPRVAATS